MKVTRKFPEVGLIVQQRELPPPPEPDGAVDIGYIPANRPIQGTGKT
jgi:hypothetical protein